MDFYTEERRTEDGFLPGDLRLDPGTNDLMEDTDELRVLRVRVIEAFDMSPADDVNHPEIFSLQRSFLESEDRQSIQERLTDAERVLRMFSDIDPATIYVRYDIHGRVQVSCRTVSGKDMALLL